MVDDQIDTPAFVAQPQVDRGVYWSREYNSKWRTCSFFHQVDELLELGASTVLEIGPGSGMVTEWLRRAGMTVTTLDMDESLDVDVHAPATDLPFDDGSFDAVLCSQVLEHMPFGEAERALKQIRRVMRTGAVVSLPDLRPWVGVSYPLYYGYHTDLVRERMPATRRALLGMLLRREIRVRDYLFVRFVPRRWGYPGHVRELSSRLIPNDTFSLPDNEQHHWEIGVEGVGLDAVLTAFDDAGLELERDFRLPEYPWHHFFRLRPGSRDA